MSRPGASSEPPQIGLALAGGAPEGAVYEIGALLALSEAIEGLDLNRLHVYVGVSSGAILGACLVNGIPIEEIVDSVTADPDRTDNPFRPETLFTPARREWLGRLGGLPRLVGNAVAEAVGQAGQGGLFGVLSRLGGSLPVGLFDNEPLRAYLADQFAQPGRSDDFRRLPGRLRVVATDLDAAAPAVFGGPGYDHVPISRALQASSALPGLYPPVEIDGRDYVDGVLLKTMHGSVALEEGARLLLSINPIVPVDTVRAVEEGVLRRGRLVDRGLPTVLAQALRTLIHSRLDVGLRAYQTEFPDADVVLFEPRRDDYRMFFTNVFRFSDRRAICAHAYRQTRADLLARQGELGTVLERHGLRLRTDVLEEEREPWPGWVEAAGRKPTARDLSRAKRSRPERTPRRPNMVPPPPSDLDRLRAALDRIEQLTA
ncbi:MAG TPA: patatin-like phospholipase family protein [Thermoanaerobaculia bacterium]|nr:patatin-like phospholipase family protein [Thermoanaerobaculia bacterium]